MQIGVDAHGADGRRRIVRAEGRAWHPSGLCHKACVVCREHGRVRVRDPGGVLLVLFWHRALGM